MRCSESFRDLPSCANNPSIERTSSSSTLNAPPVPVPPPTPGRPPAPGAAPLRNNADAVSHFPGVVPSVPTVAAPPPVPVPPPPPPPNRPPPPSPVSPPPPPPNAPAPTPRPPRRLILHHCPARTQVPRHPVRAPVRPSHRHRRWRACSLPPGSFAASCWGLRRSL